jgi:hypothetical protein
VVCLPGNPFCDVHRVADSDVYLHRRSPWWTEDPRMLFGAMLAGVAVLCPRTSAYAEYVTDGVDGWLYDDHQDVLGVVEALRGDRQRAVRAGHAARAMALARFAPAALSAAYTNCVSEWMRNR